MSELDETLALAPEVEKALEMLSHGLLDRLADTLELHLQDWLVALELVQRPVRMITELRASLTFRWS